jgi:HPt (histidine-containing phosphotransfer) domain-containing protein
MNFEDLAINVEMEKQEFLEMIGLFLETSATDLTDLHSALEKEEGLRAASAAHSIKGAAASLGLTEIHELAKRIEMEALGNHFGQTSEKILALHEKLNHMAEKLKQEWKAQSER